MLSSVEAYTSILRQAQGDNNIWSRSCWAPSKHTTYPSTSSGWQ